jgi:L-2-hydroxyglutarate oxidase LhgO
MIAGRGQRRVPRLIRRSEADMDKVDCVVVGAGVIGLSIARRLARAGREVIVLEATEGIGTITSSRNSEVIHAGIYYRAGSLMAQMCVSGKRALYRYCREHGIPIAIAAS